MSLKLFAKNRQAGGREADARRTSRRDALKLAGAGAVGGLALAGLPTQGAAASPASVPTVSESVWAPIVGSWLVQVRFSPTNPQLPPYENGRTESAFFTFTPGGGLVVTGPFSCSASGYWQLNPDGTYSVVVVEFAYDPATNGVKTVVVPWSTYVMSPDHNTITVTSGHTDVYLYDPQTGALLSSHRATYSINDADPADTVTGTRILLGWTPPVFPPEPQPQ